MIFNYLQPAKTANGASSEEPKQGDQHDSSDQQETIATSDSKENLSLMNNHWQPSSPNRNPTDKALNELPIGKNRTLDFDEPESNNSKFCFEPNDASRLKSHTEETSSNCTISGYLEIESSKTTELNAGDFFETKDGASQSLRGTEMDNLSQNEQVLDSSESIQEDMISNEQVLNSVTDIREDPASVSVEAMEADTKSYEAEDVNKIPSTGELTNSDHEIEQEGAKEVSSENKEHIEPCCNTSQSSVSHNSSLENSQNTYHDPSKDVTSGRKDNDNTLREAVVPTSIKIERNDTDTGECSVPDVENHPQVTAVKAEHTQKESELDSAGSHSAVTQAMLDEEEQYKKENENEMRKLKGEALQQMNGMQTQAQRFARLQHLLTRSNIYAQFLLKKMEEQRKAEQKAGERQQQKQKKEADEHEKKGKDSQTTKAKDKVGNSQVNESHESQSSQSSTHQTRSKRQPKKADAKETTKKKERPSKRKRNTETEYKIADIIDKEALENTVKRQKLEETQVKPGSSKDDQVVPQNNKEQKDQFTRRINGEPVSDRQPKLLTGGVLRNYQLDGVEWLKGLFENGINGILADEMGLGKTLQSIALVAHVIEKGIRGPFLIAAPLSTLPNWLSEFKRFAPDIYTILYHGTKDERARLRDRKLMKLQGIPGYKSFPVVITSYEIIMRDRIFLQHLQWKYIIIDEGHRIKNLNCRLIRELKSYQSANRLLLTGTPLQNNLAELWSLLNFLLPDIFDDLNSFQAWFDFSAVEEEGGHEQIIAQEQEAHVLETLHAILTPFLLRRLKTDVDLSIPPKKELLVYAPLTKEQESYYKSTLDKTILDKIGEKHKPQEVIEYTNTGRPKRKSVAKVSYAEVDDDSEEIDFDKLIEEMEKAEAKKQELYAARKRNYVSEKAVVTIRLQNILMQLRKCCNHPYLLEYPLDPNTKEYLIDENLVRHSGKMLLLDRMLPELRKHGHKVLIFSQMTRMLDILQDYCFLRNLGFSRIDGSMAFVTRQEQIEQFNNDSDVFIFLLSTRAGGLGLNLAAADTCIIYDSDWNPQVDLQAQDRCHRIGQSRPVIVYRFVTANTVDQRVVERAAGKRKLEKMVIHKDKNLAFNIRCDDDVQLQLWCPEDAKLSK